VLSLVSAGVRIVTPAAFPPAGRFELACAVLQTADDEFWHLVGPGGTEARIGAFPWGIPLAEPSALAVKSITERPKWHLMSWFVTRQTIHRCS